MQSLLGVIFDLVGIIFFLTDRFSFLLYLLRGMGKFPSASIVYCLHSSCVHNTPSLLGVNLSFNYCFLPSCLARFIFLFFVRGPRGGNHLQAMYRSIQFSKIVMRRYRACELCFALYLANSIIAFSFYVSAFYQNDLS